MTACLSKLRDLLNTNALGRIGSDLVRFSGSKGDPAAGSVRGLEESAREAWGRGGSALQLPPLGGVDESGRNNFIGKGASVEVRV